MNNLQLYNTLSRKKEPFAPLKTHGVTLYTCGPTVYNYAHIGNLRTYLFEDVLKRVLNFTGFKLKHVMNITDVGHLTGENEGDADQGEDKMEKGAAREKKSVWDIAARYTDAFTNDLARLNIVEPDIWCKATDHIPEQIEWIKKLEEKGFTYTITDGVYYDTSKFPSYGALTGQKLSQLKEGARVEKNKEKRNPTDFALWKFSPKDSERQMEWESPWGVGFPGWHIECTAMSVKYLGETIDIHCGGIDHIPTHHTNEIAQAEAVTGKQFVRTWMHGEFLVLDKAKMAKSGEGFITLQSVIDRGIDPLAYRYFTLGTHYRKPLTFSWEALQAAQNGYENLLALAANLGEPKIGCAEYEQKFLEVVNDDLNMPRALAVMWDMLKSDNPDSAKKASLLKFDEVFGLNINRREIITVQATVGVYRYITDVNATSNRDAIEKEIRRLDDQRNEAKKSGDFKKSDALRKKAEEKGYRVEDTPARPVIKR